MSKADLDRADNLIVSKRYRAALDITKSLIRRPDSDPRAFALHALALKALGRKEEALPIDREAVRRFPQGRIGWHNLAATLGDLGKGDEAVQAVETAFRLGLDAPETWLVYARALVAVGRLDEGEQAYRRLIKRRPGEVAWGLELANLVWMRTGDFTAGDTILLEMSQMGAPPVPILLGRADLARAAGRADLAWDLMIQALRIAPDNVQALLATTQAAVEGQRLGDAEILIRQALGRAPAEPAVLNQAAIVDLALERPQQALDKVRQGLLKDPNNQSLWAWASVAARQVGDPLYDEICDYNTLVRVFDLPPPKGWPDLATFLTDLDQALSVQHKYQREPANQSVRGGSQLSHFLKGSDDPAIKAAFELFTEAVNRFLTDLPAGTDPLRSRKAKTWRFQGAWSVLLRQGGSHATHMHIEGWISSVFYVATPAVSAGAPDKQGWLAIGEPPIMLSPPCPAVTYVEPRPGRLVLFPSYVWHGVIPFKTDDRRLTMAFDIVPT
ncbi:MAG: hypothetical protein CGW95_09755 [Phenylobacterium zucineum]|nr:MAG: hypothetical protein CGW95_09755 [Phenylobacterium zucineum]